MEGWIGVEIQRVVDVSVVDADAFDGGEVEEVEAGEVAGWERKCGRRREEIKGSSQARQGAVAAWPRED